jgi:hypothetical protein
MLLVAAPALARLLPRAVRRQLLRPAAMELREVVAEVVAVRAADRKRRSCSTA